MAEQFTTGERILAASIVAGWLGVMGLAAANGPREASSQPFGMREDIATVQEVTSIHVPGGAILAE